MAKLLIFAFNFLDPQTGVCPDDAEAKYLLRGKGGPLLTILVAADTARNSGFIRKLFHATKPVAICTPARILLYFRNYENIHLLTVTELVPLSIHTTMHNPTVCKAAQLVGV